MLRNRFSLLALFVAMLAFFPRVASAEYGKVFWGSWSDGTYRYDEYFVHKDGKDYVVTLAFDVAGVMVEARVESLDDNPNPDDPNSSTQKGDRASAITLAKQKGGEAQFPAKEFSQTPIGRSLSSHGKGSSPVWNPSDEAGAGGSVKGPQRQKQEPGNLVLADTSNKSFVDTIKKKAQQKGGAAGKFPEYSGI